MEISLGAYTVVPSASASHRVTQEASRIASKRGSRKAVDMENGATCIGGICISNLGRHASSGQDLVRALLDAGSQ